MKKSFSLHHRLEVFRRYRQIIEVLVKYGFGEVLGRLNVTSRLRIGNRRLLGRAATELASKNYAERIRLALEELGPTFIKLGQVLSTRPFLVPVDLVLELSKLQDEVAPFEYNQVEEIIEKELGEKIDRIFKSFHKEPVASASLSQVHVGILKDGRKVAVKVQRPNVKKIMAVDTEVLYDLAGLFERFIPESKRYDPSGQVKELAKVSRRECDFKFEARNMEIFKINFKDDPMVVIPEVIWEFTTSRVLVCEYIDGIKVSSVDKLKEIGVDLSAVSRNGLRVVMKMIFEDRFFHGDPHPGNIFVQEDGKIVLLDFGMVGHLSDSVVEFLTNLLYSAATLDSRKILKTILDFNLIPEKFDSIGLESDLTEMLYRYHKIPLGQIDMRALCFDAMDIFYKHDIRLPSSFMLLLKALITAEELARMLDPKINIIVEIEPYVRRLMSRRMKYSVFKTDLFSTMAELRDFITTLPFDLKRITRKLREGEIEVKFRHIGLEDLTDEMYQSSKRVSLALIIAAVLVSASLLKTADVGLTILGVPVLSVLGFLLAGVLTTWLIINVLRSRKS
jgi:ubiquinone biosynthesis protein